MDQCRPNLLFLVPRVHFEVALVHFQDVASCCEFHDHAQGLRTLVVKGLFKSNDVFVVIGSQDSDFVECVLLFLGFHGCDFDLCGPEGTFLQAYYFASCLRFTLNTWPNAPSPSFERT